MKPLFIATLFFLLPLNVSAQDNALPGQLLRFGPQLSTLLLSVDYFDSVERAREALPPGTQLRMPQSIETPLHHGNKSTIYLKLMRVKKGGMGNTGVQDHGQIVAEFAWSGDQAPVLDSVYYEPSPL